MGATKLVLNQVCRVPARLAVYDIAPLCCVQVGLDWRPLWGADIPPSMMFNTTRGIQLLLH